MDTITLRAYTPGNEREWNEFVASSRNGTFLFDRRYMDYHSTRFRDASLMAYKGGRLRALLPANITDDGVIHSHQGLTYGGWVLPMGHIDGADLLSIFQAATELWSSQGITELDYKPIPAIYHRQPAEEDLYALFRLGAELTGCGLSTSINLCDGVRFNQMQRRHLRKAEQLGCIIEETFDTEEFMTLLEACLLERHGVRPVHTAGELAMLRRSFPDNIRFFVIRGKDDGKPDAGVCVYDTGTVAHAQYIATTPEARKKNMLTLLFHHLITDVFRHSRYFDFGISTEDNGAYLNEGLLRQKNSYGGSGTVYQRYRLKLV